ncbi:hypothetical protein CHLRE_06g282826v5 [Chlamydomonas reinhardtii]|uniref:Uncharacterized protein n=1 Tax=Chlamydomonas reinhardtii TaxID=3055 RepID=A0A2K3DPR5_CHLRE|nr:uncharacterized protein CHLRE_06g282826v5 [Chlamydomonas reinhardtii]PNW82534.1 hypothetical protein CHLRE_06g282826v5 [Chlamydomonas reinhardtii]
MPARDETSAGLRAPARRCSRSGARGAVTRTTKVTLTRAHLWPCGAGSAPAAAVAPTTHTPVAPRPLRPPGARGLPACARLH